MNQSTASLSDTGTSAGLDIKCSMFLEKHGTITPLTRGQIEQTPAGPAPHGIHRYRCRCCSLDTCRWITADIHVCRPPTTKRWS